MSAWKRPADFEDWAVSRSEVVAEEAEIDTVEEAFLSGALWAALVAEGRVDPEGDES